MSRTILKPEYAAGLWEAVTMIPGLPRVAQPK